MKSPQVLALFVMLLNVGIFTFGFVLAEKECPEVLPTMLGILAVEVIGFLAVVWI